MEKGENGANTRARMKCQPWLRRDVLLRLKHGFSKVITPQFREKPWSNLEADAGLLIVRQSYSNRIGEKGGRQGELMKPTRAERTVALHQLYWQMTMNAR